MRSNPETIEKKAAVRGVEGSYSRPVSNPKAITMALGKEIQERIESFPETTRRDYAVVGQVLNVIVHHTDPHSRIRGDLIEAMAIMKAETERRANPNPVKLPTKKEGEKSTMPRDWDMSN